tara:strand:- start:117 stop:2576 length:2460 start_codon:yes stop_codon:yes gene_type:complete
MLEKNINNQNNIKIGSIKDNERADVVLMQLPLWGMFHPPLALGLLKSYLGHHGISCKTYDVNAHVYSTRGKQYYDLWHLKHTFTEQFWNRQKMVKFYRSYRPIMLYYINEIRRLQPKIVGCSVYDSSRLFTSIFLEDLKKNIPDLKSKLLLGGPGVAHFMKNTDELLSLDHIDAVCQDEGEQAIIDYYNAINDDTGLPVAGMVYKKDGKILRGPPSMYKGKLDTIPFPNFEDANTQHYISRSLPTYGSRGCVNKCNYCSAIGFMTNKRYPFRLRSAQRIFDEVVYFKKKYPQVEELRFSSNIDNGKISVLEDFCDLMIESGLNKELTWSMESCVIRKEMRKPLYEKLRKAGCNFICYGLESPTKRLLKAVGKTLAVQDGVDFNAILREGKEAGIDIVINIMLGLPGETDEDVDYLLKFIEDNKDYLLQVNPAIEFCEYYPGTIGNKDPDSIGVDLSKGNLFWDSKDGTNTYLTRMKRFERVTKLARDLKISLFFEVDEIVDKSIKLFEYYYVCKDSKNAKEQYDKIKKEERTEEIDAKYIHVTTGDRTALDKFDAKVASNNVAKLEDYLIYRDTFEETLLSEPLSGHIEDFVKVQQYDRMWFIDKWKTNIRKMALSLSGYKKIKDLVDNSLLSVGKIDKTLVATADMDTSTSDKFSSVKKDINAIDSIINNTDKDMNNFLSKFIKKLNKTSYYHEKINKMLRLFVKAFRIINNKETRSNESIEPIVEELKQLLNSTDKNENKIFTDLELESRLVSFYNRVVGYRHTERGMSMLHTVINLAIKKLEALKDQEDQQTVKISTQNRYSNKHNNGTSQYTAAK